MVEDELRWTRVDMDKLVELENFVAIPVRDTGNFPKSGDNGCNENRLEMYFGYKINITW